MDETPRKLATIHNNSLTELVDEDVSNYLDVGTDVDSVSSHLGMLHINTTSRLIRSNFAAFETYRRLDGLHRKGGKKSSLLFNLTSQHTENSVHLP